jgi:hypothetical protein
VNYATTPLTPGANLLLRFMHDFGGGDSFDYETANIPFTGVASYIDGYAVKPIIGKEPRLLNTPIARKAAESLHTRSGSKWRICSQ